jgi:quinol monooxygenase YgiN
MSADEEVSWHVEVSIQAGRFDDFRTLTDEMTEHARSEPDTLAYERFLADDGETAWLYERYRTANAAVAHLRAFVAVFGARWGDVIRRRRFVVCGAASPELRAILDGFGAQYGRRVAGFSRAG